MPTKVIMPQLGESVVEGTISRWLKQEGEPIEEFEPLLEVNTDKVDSEIPAPAEGVLLKVTVPEGETVRAGTIIAWIGEAGESVPEGTDGGAQKQAAQKGEEKQAGQPKQSAAQPPERGPKRDLGFISPIVAKLAQEHNLDLSQIKGTGHGGRITKKDVLAFVDRQQDGQKAKQAEPEAPAWETPGEGDLFRPTEMVFGQAKPQSAARLVEPAAPHPAAATSIPPSSEESGGKLVPLSNIRRRIAEHMTQSVRTAPHVTTVMEADLSKVVADYQEQKPVLARDGIHLTYTSYFAAATARALRAVPLANSSWTDDGILLHQQINLGIAVSLGEEGLIVPVIKNADGLSLLGLARAIKDLAERARSRSLQPDEIKDGTMTITNHGITGSLFANPIINQPQSGIVGVGAIQKRVVVTPEDAIAVKPMVYLSFTFDHRILDGASADGFLGKVVEYLVNWK